MQVTVVRFASGGPRNPAIQSSPPRRSFMTTSARFAAQGGGLVAGGMGGFGRSEDDEETRFLFAVFFAFVFADMFLDI